MSAETTDIKVDSSLAAALPFALSLALLATVARAA